MRCSCPPRGIVLVSKVHQRIFDGRVIDRQRRLDKRGSRKCDQPGAIPLERVDQILRRELCPRQPVRQHISREHALRGIHRDHQIQPVPVSSITNIPCAARSARRSHTPGQASPGRISSAAAARSCSPPDRGSRRAATSFFSKWSRSISFRKKIPPATARAANPQNHSGAPNVMAASSMRLAEHHLERSPAPARPSGTTGTGRCTLRLFVLTVDFSSLSISEKMSLIDSVSAAR